ncbi:MAG: oligosaccharide flippase family protein [Candidatus Helarchaeota archaeon]
MSNFKQKIKQNTFYTFIGKILEIVFNFLILWLLVNKLSTADYGIYNLLFGMATYLGIISSAGLVPAFTRYLPEFFQKKEYDKFLWTIKFGLIFRFIVFVILIIFILLFYNKIGPFFNIQNYSIYFIVFSIGLVFLFQAQMLQHILEGIFLHKYVVLSQFFYSLLRISLLYLIFYLGYTLFQVLLVELFSALFLYIILFLFFLYKNYNQIKGDRTFRNLSKTRLLKRLFRYSSFSLFNEIGKGFLDISTDYFVISHFLGTHFLGVYAFGARIGRLISQLLPSRFLRNIITPAFFARYSISKNGEELNKMFRFLSKLNAFLLFPIFILVAIFAEEIIKFIFDPKYLESYSVLIIFLIHFMMLAFPTALPLQAVERPEFVLIAKSSSIYNLVMDIILIQFFGIIGVAIATTSAIIVKRMLEYYMSKKYANILFPWKGILKILINCLPLIIFAYWFKSSVNSALSLIIIFVFLEIIYLIISFFNKVFIEEERIIINSILGKKCFVF